MKKFKRIGIDLAKNVFQVCAVDHAEKRVINKKLRRAEVLKFFSDCEPCLIGLEACGTAHYWARELMKLGHEVKLIAPQKVKAYVVGHKNDMRDAEAICEAVGRPHMKFVTVKNENQQGYLSIHKMRQNYVRARTGCINVIRGLLGEFGYHAHQGKTHVYKLISEVLTPESPLPGVLKEAITIQKALLEQLDENIEKLESLIHQHGNVDERVKQIQAIEGIGPITASALVAELGNGSQFNSGRQFAANLGLVPKQHSSGGKDKLGSITKRGDVYIRTLLIQGARAVLQKVGNKTGCKADWLNELLVRKSSNVVAVALANKTARTVWAILNKNTEYRCEMRLKEAA